VSKERKVKNPHWWTIKKGEKKKQQLKYGDSAVQPGLGDIGGGGGEPKRTSKKDRIVERWGPSKPEWPIGGETTLYCPYAGARRKSPRLSGRLTDFQSPRVS